MGWSMVTLEDTPYNNKTGEIMTEYMKIPRSTEIPDLDNFKVFFANTYEPTGPLGAKGLGEGALNPVAGAIANAISAALGIRFYELPITPEKILKALEEKKKELLIK
jgi:xanthine dehydrogenase molybdenum-binding subunit